MWHDLRYVIRSLSKNPGFTFVAILTLAIGIGASTAVFSVVDLILFRPLPYSEPDRLVSVGFFAAPIRPEEFMFGRVYQEQKATFTPFEAMTSWAGVVTCDLVEDNPERLACAQVESNFLSVLGVPPALGRNFVAEEDLPGAEAVALISYDLWQRRYGSDRNILDRMISMDGKPARVIGVLAADFEMPSLERVDVMVPQVIARRGGLPVSVVGRLREGVSPELARTALQPWFAEFVKSAPPTYQNEVSLRVRPLRDRQIENVGRAAWVLFVSVLAVLLIAATNVANLLLSRMVSRQREFAVRRALGAGAARLARQCFTESLVLAGAGGVLGCVMSYVLLDVFLAVGPAGILRLQQASVDLRALLFTVLLSVGSGLVAGLLPALARQTISGLVGSHQAGPSRLRSRHGLVVVQIALSVVLLAGAGVLLRSLWNLQHVDLGIQPDNVSTVRFFLSPARYPTLPEQLSFFNQLEERVEAMPGVAAAGLTDSLPPSESALTQPYSVLIPDGQRSPESGTGGILATRLVSPGYFEALGIRILSGRSFQDSDQDPGQNPILVNETLAQRLFPNGGAVGQQVQSYTVIGVAADVANGPIERTVVPEYYKVRKRRPDPVFSGRLDELNRNGILVIRSALSPASVTAAVRAVVRDLDPNLPVTFGTLTERVEDATARSRFIAALLGLFAAIGLIVAAVGLYGVMSFWVSRRTPEMAVRLAVGATRADIAKLVLASAARVTFAGVLIGLAGTLTLNRLLGTLLYNVRANDPSIMALAVALLVAAAFVGAWLPSRRASSIDPMNALRHE
jgi:predicted permease